MLYPNQDAEALNRDRLTFKNDPSRVTMQSSLRTAKKGDLKGVVESADRGERSFEHVDLPK